MRLQPLTRARLRTMGRPGQVWQDSLPRLLADLESSWSIVIGRGLAGGSASYVARARTAEGRSAVVKVAVSDQGWADQVTTLARAEGRGYARLLRADSARHAVLLEALGPTLSSSGWSSADQLRCLADTLAMAWQDPGERRPASGADKASWLADLISRLWPQRGRPCSQRVINRALEYGDRRAADAHLDLVVVHGDPHPGNLLAVPAPRPGAETGYVFVDPDGLVADRAYDLGVAMRDWSGSLGGQDAARVARGFCAVLAERSGVDGQRIWEWGFLERVSTGLYLLDLGAPMVARPFLASAERLI